MSKTQTKTTTAPAKQNERKKRVCERETLTATTQQKSNM